MPTVANRYRLDTEIGRGSASIVYKAYDERTHDLCALKILRRVPTRNETWRRFEREVKLMTELRHRHILRVFDYDLSGTRPWMAMAYARAGSVRGHLDRRGPLPLGAVMVHGVEILGALDIAHRAGVIHRDIKPSNLLRSATGLQVADFGIAAVLEDLSGNGALGSMAFMAPEVFAGEPTPAADLFAVGVTLFVMASNGNPFDLSRDPPDSPRLRTVSRELRNIIFRAVRPDPAGRFANALDMAQALANAARRSSFGPLVLEALSRATELAPGAATGYPNG